MKLKRRPMKQLNHLGTKLWEVETERWSVEKGKYPCAHDLEGVVETWRIEG